MRWLVCDSLSTPEQYYCSHLDSYRFYLGEAGEDSWNWCINTPPRPDGFDVDVLFALDGFQQLADFPAKVRIAQIAAVVPVMPWDVRKPDGSPAYDLVVSSLHWQVEEARKHGCRAEWMPLAFDERARVCGMGVQRDLGCIFVGSQGGNHRWRTDLLRELSDVVTVVPPCWGRDYFRTLARARAVFHCGAEWARGEANAMRLYEASGMGCAVISDGSHDTLGFLRYRTAAEARECIGKAIAGDWGPDCLIDVLCGNTYVNRIPQLITWAKELLR